MVELFFFLSSNSGSNFQRDLILRVIGLPLYAPGELASWQSELPRCCAMLMQTLAKLPLPHVKGVDLSPLPYTLGAIGWPPPVNGHGSHTRCCS